MEQLLELKKQAEQGDMQARFELAMKYIRADGVEKDDAAAAELLEQAAEEGHREAAYQLGICYHHGYGVETDLKTAYQLYLRSALQGYGKGYNMVGDFYADGICVIEWSENIAEVLPKNTVSVTIEKIGENERRIEF